MPSQHRQREKRQGLHPPSSWGPLSCLTTQLPASNAQPLPKYTESSSVSGRWAGARLNGRASQGGSSYSSSSSSSSPWAFQKGQKRGSTSGRHCGPPPSTPGSAPALTSNLLVPGVGQGDGLGASLFQAGESGQGTEETGLTFQHPLPHSDFLSFPHIINHPRFYSGPFRLLHWTQRSYS